MSHKSELLNDIYKKLKEKRVVLNKTEFAAKLGYSRPHLHRLMKEDDDIPDELMKGANKLLEQIDLLNNDTNNVNEDQAVYFTKNMDAGKAIGYIMEDVIMIKASIKIIGQEVCQLNSKLNKTSFSSEALELSKNIGLEADRLFAELKQKG